MAAITDPCICKQLRETFPITLIKRGKKKPSTALCSSIHPSADSLIFFCMCQSQQKVFLRAAFLSPFPAFTAINHAAAVTAEESD